MRWAGEPGAGLSHHAAVPGVSASLLLSAGGDPRHREARKPAPGHTPVGTRTQPTQSGSGDRVPTHPALMLRGAQGGGRDGRQALGKVGLTMPPKCQHHDGPGASAASTDGAGRVIEDENKKKEESSWRRKGWV